MADHLLFLRRSYSKRHHKMRNKTPWLAWLVSYRIKRETKYLTDSIWTPEKPHAQS